MNDRRIAVIGMAEGVPGDTFDPGFFAVADPVSTPPSRRVFLMTAHHALEDAGYAGGGVRAGLWAGPPESTVDDETAARLRLPGPAVGVWTGASTALVAVQLAARALLDGEADLALAGHWDDASGASVLALKHLDRALADGDRVHAVILGVAVSADAETDALNAAGVSAEDVTLSAADLVAAVRAVRDGEENTVGPRLASVAVDDAHAVVAQHHGMPHGARRSDALPPVPALLPVSAGHADTLRELAAAYRARLDQAPRAADVVTTAALGRRHARHRLVVYGATDGEFAEGLDAYLSGTRSEHYSAYTASDRVRPVFAYTGLTEPGHKTAKALYERCGHFRDVLDEAGARFARLAGRPLVPIALGDAAPEPGTALPAQFAVQAGMTALWRHLGVRPHVVLGHGFGELAALHAAGGLSLADGMRLVTGFSALVEQDTPPGGMVTVLADRGTVDTVLAACPGLTLAIVNGPENHVLAGAAGTVDKACRLAKALDLRWQRVPVTRAYHAAPLDEIRGALRALAESVTWRAIQTPFLSGLDGSVRPAGWTPGAAYVVAQSRQTVRFDALLEELADTPDAVLLEVGTQPMLTRLARAAAPGVPAIPSGREDAEVDAFHRAIGELHCAGVPVDWGALTAESDGRRTDLPLYPFRQETIPPAPSTGDQQMPRPASTPVPVATGGRDALAEAIRLAAEAAATAARAAEHLASDRPVAPAATASASSPDIGLCFVDAVGGGYSLLREAARFSEEHGLRTLWLPGRAPLGHAGPFPSAAVLATALAADTSAVRLHAAVPVPDVVRTAEEWAMVDNLSGGRVALTLLDAPDADVAAFDAFWLGSPLDDVRLHPAPVQHDAPLSLRAETHADFERAGRLGVDVLADLVTFGPAELRAGVEAYRAAGGGRVVVELYTHLAADLAAARREAFGPLSRTLATDARLLASLGADASGDREEEFRRAYDRFCGTRTLIGTPASAGTLVESLRDMGVDELAAIVDFGVPPTAMREGWTPLAELRARFAPARPALPAPRKSPETGGVESGESIVYGDETVTPMKSAASVDTAAADERATGHAADDRAASGPDRGQRVIEREAESARIQDGRPTAADRPAEARSHESPRPASTRHAAETRGVQAPDADAATAMETDTGSAGPAASPAGDRPASSPSGPSGPGAVTAEQDGPRAAGPSGPGLSERGLSERGLSELGNAFGGRRRGGDTGGERTSPTGPSLFAAPGTAAETARGTAGSTEPGDRDTTAEGSATEPDHDTHSFARAALDAALAEADRADREAATGTTGAQALPAEQTAPDEQPGADERSVPDGASAHQRTGRSDMDRPRGRVRPGGYDEPAIGHGDQIGQIGHTEARGSGDTGGVPDERSRAPRSGGDAPGGHPEQRGEHEQYGQHGQGSQEGPQGPRRQSGDPAGRWAAHPLADAAEDRASHEGAARADTPVGERDTRPAEAPARHQGAEPVVAPAHERDTRPAASSGGHGDHGGRDGDMPGSHTTDPGLGQGGHGGQISRGGPFSQGGQGGRGGWDDTRRPGGPEADPRTGPVSGAQAGPGAHPGPGTHTGPETHSGPESHVGPETAGPGAYAEARDAGSEQRPLRRSAVSFVPPRQQSGGPGETIPSAPAEAGRGQGSEEGHRRAAEAPARGESTVYGPGARADGPVPGTPFGPRAATAEQAARTPGAPEASGGFADGREAPVADDSAERPGSRAENGFAVAPGAEGPAAGRSPVDRYTAVTAGEPSHAAAQVAPGEREAPSHAPDDRAPETAGPVPAPAHEPERPARGGHRAPEGFGAEPSGTEPTGAQSFGTEPLETGLIETEPFEAEPFEARPSGAASPEAEFFGAPAAGSAPAQDQRPAGSLPQTGFAPAAPAEGGPSQDRPMRSEAAQGDAAQSGSAQGGAAQGDTAGARFGEIGSVPGAPVPGGAAPAAGPVNRFPGHAAEPAGPRSFVPAPVTSGLQMPPQAPAQPRPPVPEPATGATTEPAAVPVHGPIDGPAPVAEAPRGPVSGPPSTPADVARAVPGVSFAPTAPPAPAGVSGRAQVPAPVPAPVEGAAQHAPVPEAPAGAPDAAAVAEPDTRSFTVPPAPAPAPPTHPYLTRLLSAPVPVLSLPADRMRTGAPPERFGVEECELGLKLTGALTRLGEPQGPDAPVLAGVAITLRRFSGQDDLIIGRADGPPVRVDLGGDPSFAEVMHRVRTSLAEAAGFDGPAPEVPVATAVGARAAEISWSLLPHAGGATVQVGYAADLFEPHTARRLGHYLRDFLTAASEDPQQRLSQLDDLSDDDMGALDHWHRGSHADLPDAPVDELVAAHAARTPDAVAAVCGQDSLTYETLDVLANQVAHQLRGLGVGPSDVVGVLMPRDLRLIVSLLAVVKTGAAYLSLDPFQDPEAIAHVLADSRAKLTVAETGLAGLLPEDAPRMSPNPGELAEYPGTPLERVAGPDDACYVVYDSRRDSSGQSSPAGHGSLASHGVVVSHRSVTNLCGWYHRRFRVTAEDRASVLCRPGGDASVLEIWPALTAGAAIVVATDDVPMTAPDVARWFAMSAATIAVLPTGLGEALLALPDAVRHAGALRSLIVSGDPLYRRPRGDLPFEVVNAYGPTEATVMVASHTATSDGEGGVLLGSPIDNTRLYVLDGAGRPVPVGVPGELYVAGDCLASGYLHADDLTARRFPVDGAGQRYYRTGDLARWTNGGVLEFKGRINEQVPLGGHRVDPGEVAGRLRTRPGVADAAVLAMRAADGSPYLAAFVVPDGDPSDLSVGLPPYLVPARWVTMDALPYDLGGRLDRDALLTALTPPEDRRSGPLASVQSRMAGFSERLGAALNIAVPVDLSGDLDTALLKEALTRLAVRHHSLRSRFFERDGAWVQEVLDDPEGRLKSLDLTALPEQQRGERAGQRADEARAELFDLGDGHAWRAVLIRLGEHEWRLVLVFHHLLTDDWARHLFLTELAELYNALAEGRQPRLPEPSQAIAYALAERRPDEDARMDYWTRRLDGVRLSLPLPYDTPDASGGRVFTEVPLPAEVVEGALTLARETACAPYSVFAAALGVFLSKMTGAGRIVLRTQYPDRDDPRSARLMASLATAAVLDLDIAPGLGFADLVTAVEHDHTEGLANHVALHRLLDVLAERGSAAPGELPQFLFPGAFVGTLPLSGVRASLENPPVTPGLPGTVFVCVPGTDAWHLGLSHSPAQLRPETATAWLDTYATVLAQLCAEPETPIGEL
ncbi:hypothetical protein Afil01_56140 [Actinorhabdospora filicis]|uniref:Acyltransferase domain-containing protein n=1 Tax=Actinorhabdospora filicis TaxID=1785913 RepID=A0A9W6SS28_9ACTN|nr:AMP-binding protein [Actinorhabdospora filicis]GLZ80807.1 hypothetical protein Afil01_56140 [Actinorhabdospora filicis]